MAVGILLSLRYSLVPLERVLTHERYPRLNYPIFVKRDFLGKVRTDDPERKCSGGGWY